jgi:hypothetical protein
MKTIFIKCSCGSESLCLEKDPETGELYVSIWERGCYNDNRFSWRQRIKHCWYVLTKGKPYGDQIVLDRAGRGELVHALVEAHLVKAIESDSEYPYLQTK